MVVNLLFLVPALIFSSYLAVLTIAAALKGKQFKVASAKSQRRFAILVPSHDEEAVIENTLASLGDLDYPRDRYDVIVIADNCSDKTADIARSHGDVVFERFDDTNKGKGQALRWCLDRLKSEGAAYDAFVIIDADTVASSNLLTVMNDYLEEGAMCIQCSTLVTPQPGAWSPEMTRIGFLLHNYTRPLGKKALGLSMGLNGNGMCLSSNLLSSIPWSAYSRVEDLEHALKLAIEGVRVIFAPEAYVHAIMPTDSRLAESQRRRWELARFSIIKNYTWTLLSAAIRKRSLVIFDMLMDLITPAFVNLFVLTVAGLLVNAAGTVVLEAPSALLWMMPAYFGALLLETFHVVGGLKVANADRGAYRTLMSTPKYALWKFKLYIRTIIKGDDKLWLRTERERSLPTGSAGESTDTSRRTDRSSHRDEGSTRGEENIRFPFQPRVMSVRIDTLNAEEVMKKIGQFLKDSKLHTIATVNPEFVMTARKDREFLRILNHADLNIADGIGVQLAMKMMYGEVCERITGVDLTWRLTGLAAEQGYSIFLLGAAEGVARDAAAKMKERYPALKIAGYYSGRPDEEGLVECINLTNPDILLVAFGAPKQEKFIFKNAKTLNAKIAMGVGGTFDYIAGVVPRAPAWMRRLGMEWLYRLANQPERIGRILTATVRYPIAMYFYKSSKSSVSRKVLGESLNELKSTIEAPSSPAPRANLVHSNSRAVEV